MIAEEGREACAGLLCSTFNGYSCRNGARTCGPCGGCEGGVCISKCIPVARLNGAAGWGGSHEAGGWGGSRGAGGWGGSRGAGGWDHVKPEGGKDYVELEHRAEGGDHVEVEYAAQVHGVEGGDHVDVVEDVALVERVCKLVVPCIHHNPRQLQYPHNHLECTRWSKMPDDSFLGQPGGRISHLDYEVLFSAPQESSDAPLPILLLDLSNLAPPFPP